MRLERDKQLYRRKEREFHVGCYYIFYVYFFVICPGYNLSGGKNSGQAHNFENLIGLNFQNCALVRVVHHTFLYYM